MIDALFGWYLRENLGCKFNNIVFQESLLENSKKTGLGTSSALDGTTIKTNFSGSNFVITSIIMFSTPGYLKITVYPDNDTTKKFTLLSYGYTQQPLPIPVLSTTDIVIDIENTQNQVNDLLLIFSGFWISEDRTPEFTITSEKIFTALDNIDMQTLEALGLLDTIISLITQYMEAEGIEYTTPDYYSNIVKSFIEAYTAVKPSLLFCKR